jgi:hypothetical protein
LDSLVESLVESVVDTVDRATDRGPGPSATHTRHQMRMSK